MTLVTFESGAGERCNECVGEDVNKRFLSSCASSDTTCSLRLRALLFESYNDTLAIFLGKVSLVVEVLEPYCWLWAKSCCCVKLLIRNAYNCSSLGALGACSNSPALIGE